MLRLKVWWIREEEGREEEEELLAGGVAAAAAMAGRPCTCHAPLPRQLRLRLGQHLQVLSSQPARQLPPNPGPCNLNLDPHPSQHSLLCQVPKSLQCSAWISSTQGLAGSRAARGLRATGLGRVRARSRTPAEVGKHVARSQSCLQLVRVERGAGVGALCEAWIGAGRTEAAMVAIGTETGKRTVTGRGKGIGTGTEKETGSESERGVTWSGPGLATGEAGNAVRTGTVSGRLATAIATGITIGIATETATGIRAESETLEDACRKMYVWSEHGSLA
ncbi:hypothetical protein V8C86DRAFT_2865657 [Haematococcus lacustris]